MDTESTKIQYCSFRLYDVFLCTPRHIPRQRKVLGNFYAKRKVQPDGVSMTHLDI